MYPVNFWVPNLIKQLSKHSKIIAWSYRENNNKKMQNFPIFYFVVWIALSDLLRIDRKLLYQNQHLQIR